MVCKEWYDFKPKNILHNVPWTKLKEMTSSQRRGEQSESDRDKLIGIEIGHKFKFDEHIKQLL